MSQASISTIKFIRRFLYTALLVVTASPAFSSIRDIDLEKLPRVPAVHQAYVNVSKVEFMASRWQPQWRYSTPRKEVAAVIKKSLAALEKAVGGAPDNTELQLLTGLVASYAYNLDLDVEKTEAALVKSFSQAQRLSPEDFRAQWFLGHHQCQTQLVQEGMQKLLALEKEHSWKELPADFWDDYLECAVFSHMPSHGLRAYDYALNANAEPGTYREIYAQTLKESIKKSEPSVNYPARQIWYAESAGKQITFTNTMFGFAITAQADWDTDIADIQKGVATARFKIGPYPGNGEKVFVFPSILVLVRPPKAGESLEDFLHALVPQGSSQPAKGLACPVQECMALEAIKPGAYGSDGDGYGFFIAFQHRAPEYPGLLFEKPSAPPLPTKKAHFRLSETMQRLDGTLYYLVLLDTAVSVRGQAMNDFESFIKKMQVE